MKNILKKRTGKTFQRNLEAAPVPIQENKLSHEEVADQIFDNIIRRKREKASRAAEETDETSELQAVETTQSVGAEEQAATDSQDLDAILWPDEVVISQDVEQSDSQSQPVYESAREHVDALARQYAAELDEILGFD